MIQAIMKMINKIMILLLLAFCSCENPLDIPEPMFEVVGYDIEDTFDEDGNLKKQVTFQLEGTADVISFYSGAVGGDYEYRDGRIVKLLGLEVSFSSNCTFGDQGCDVFSVLASTDFNGGNEPEDVQKATWLDITDRFTISPHEATNAVYHESGKVDVSDLTVEENPLYLAMRHETHNQVINGALANVYTAFRIRDWRVTSETELGTAEIANQGDGGLYLVEIGNFRPGRNVLGGIITLRGNHGNVNNDLEHLEAETEGWVISSPIEAGDIDLGPDRPVSIKSREDLPMTSFSYEYDEPGEYEAVFYVSNVNIEGEKAKYKKVKIMIPE